jgi:mRNA interferase RelE/StbE
MTFVNRLKGYRLSYSSRAKKFIEKLDKRTALYIVQKLEQLVNGNENLDVKKLSGSSEPRFRLRVGDFRLIYEVSEHEVIVYVIDVGHRREIYRS